MHYCFACSPTQKPNGIIASGPPLGCIPTQKCNGICCIRACIGGTPTQKSNGSCCIRALVGGTPTQKTIRNRWADWVWGDPNQPKTPICHLLGVPPSKAVLLLFAYIGLGRLQCNPVHAPIGLEGLQCNPGHTSIGFGATAKANMLFAFAFASIYLTNQTGMQCNASKATAEGPLHCSASNAILCVCCFGLGGTQSKDSLMQSIGAMSSLWEHWVAVYPKSVVYCFAGAAMQ